MERCVGPKTLYDGCAATSFGCVGQKWNAVWGRRHCMTAAPPPFAWQSLQKKCRAGMYRPTFIFLLALGLAGDYFLHVLGASVFLNGNEVYALAKAEVVTLCAVVGNCECCCNASCEVYYAYLLACACTCYGERGARGRRCARLIITRCNLDLKSAPHLCYTLCHDVTVVLLPHSTSV